MNERVYCRMQGQNVGGIKMAESWTSLHVITSSYMLLVCLSLLELLLLMDMIFSFYFSFFNHMEDYFTLLSDGYAYIIYIFVTTVLVDMCYQYIVYGYKAVTK